MLPRRFGYRSIGALTLLSSMSCSDVNLRTTTLSEENSNTVNSDAGVVSDTFFVSGPTLFDPCGKPVILRGVNEMVTFTYESKDGSAYFGEIAKTGANSIRIYWTTSDTKDDLDRLLTNAEANKLLPIIYVFNYPNDLTQVSDAANFWVRPEISAVVQKHQRWLIIALRERALQATGTLDDWASKFDSAVRQLRAAQINVPLAIDAPNYGQDIDSLTLPGQNTLRGQERILADPQHNVLLNVNAWWLNYTPDMITSKITSAANASLPLMIGEFSDYLKPQLPQLQCTPFDYATLIHVAQQMRVGWQVWSWGAAHNTDCNMFDMTVGGQFSALVVPWGQDVAVTNTDSIHNTSVPAKYTPGRGCQ